MEPRWIVALGAVAIGGCAAATDAPDAVHRAALIPLSDDFNDNSINSMRWAVSMNPRRG